MKYVDTLFLILLVLTLLMGSFLTSCKKDDPTPLTAQQDAAKKLSVTWGAAEVLEAPIPNASGTLSNLVLTFTATSNFTPDAFSATGAPGFFTTSSSSKWNWAGTGGATEIVLTAVSPVQGFMVEELTINNLTISFTLSGPIGGRVAGVGQYKVRFTKM